MQREWPASSAGRREIVLQRGAQCAQHTVLLQQTAAVVDFLLALLQTILSMLVNASQCYSQLHSQLYSQLALIAVRKIKFPEPSFIISIYLKSDFKSSAISSTGLESAASDLWLFRRLGLFVPGNRGHPDRDLWRFVMESCVVTDGELVTRFL